MKFLTRTLAYSLLVLFGLVLASIFFGISDHADNELTWSLSHEDIMRARKILHEGSKTKPDEIGTLVLNKEDINLAANYLLNRYSKSAVNIRLRQNSLRFMVTATLPDNFIGKYVNVTFKFSNEDDNSTLPVISKFKAGKLLLPSKLVAFVIDRFVQQSSLNQYVLLASRYIKTIDIRPEQVTVVYHSNPETLIQAKNLLAHGSDNQAMNVYQLKLAAILSQHDPSWRLSLAELLKPLFQLAYQRSTSLNAIEENRLVIFAVNEYVNQQETKKFLGTQDIRPIAGKQYPTFLYKRIDLAKHFIGSAAITASVNGQVSKAIGEEKELSDAIDGSGFSFIDLAADKAGTRFGELATLSPQSARNMQLAMSQIKDYADFMPDPRDLPEHMNEAEFKYRYGSTNSPTYHALVKQIESRINAMPLYAN
ncbi:MAG: hypothetical protein WC782_12990 [Methylococcaceae bacterium]|jgi:hypothetical protein